MDGSAAPDSAPEELLALLYTSRAVRLSGSTWIDAVVARAREKNRALGITGCLLHHDGGFMQYIEGPPSMIDALFETIRADRRHHEIQLQYRARITQREFPAWLMAHSDIDATLWNKLYRYARDRADGPASRQLLAEFLSAARRSGAPRNLAGGLVDAQAGGVP